MSSNGKKIEAYIGKDIVNGAPLAVLGSYKNACGGMDTISDKHDRVALIEKYLNGHPWQVGKKGRDMIRRTPVLIFEGLITGKTYGQIGEISDFQEQRGKWIYTFMDTPFEECARRVLVRRQTAFMAKHGEAAIDDRVFDPERTMRSTFKSVQSVRAKAIAKGYHHIYDVKHKQKPSVAAAALLNRVAQIAAVNPLKV